MENTNLQKNLFFEDWDFFLQNWEKSHLNSIGYGAKMFPGNTKKNLHLHSDFMYASSKCSGVSVHMPLSDSVKGTKISSAGQNHFIVCFVFRF